MNPNSDHPNPPKHVIRSNDTGFKYTLYTGTNWENVQKPIIISRKDPQNKSHSEPQGDEKIGPIDQATQEMVNFPWASSLDLSGCVSRRLDSMDKYIQQEIDLIREKKPLEQHSPLIDTSQHILDLIHMCRATQEIQLSAFTTIENKLATPVKLLPEKNSQQCLFVDTRNGTFGESNLLLFDLVNRARSWGIHVLHLSSQYLDHPHPSPSYRHLIHNLMVTIVCLQETHRLLKEDHALWDKEEIQLLKTTTNVQELTPHLLPSHGFPPPDSENGLSGEEEEVPLVSDPVVGEKEIHTEDSLHRIHHNHLRSRTFSHQDREPGGRPHAPPQPQPQPHAQPFTRKPHERAPIYHLTDNSLYLHDVPLPPLETPTTTEEGQATSKSPSRQECFHQLSASFQEDLSMITRLLEIVLCETQSRQSTKDKQDIRALEYHYMAHMKCLSLEQFKGRYDLSGHISSPRDPHSDGSPPWTTATLLSSVGSWLWSWVSKDNQLVIEGLKKNHHFRVTPNFTIKYQDDVGFTWRASPTPCPIFNNIPHVTPSELWRSTLLKKGRIIPTSETTSSNRLGSNDSFQPFHDHIPATTLSDNHTSSSFGESPEEFYLWFERITFLMYCEAVVCLKRQSLYHLATVMQDHVLLICPPGGTFHEQSRTRVTLNSLVDSDLTTPAVQDHAKPPSSESDQSHPPSSDSPTRVTNYQTLRGMNQNFTPSTQLHKEILQLLVSTPHAYTPFVQADSQQGKELVELSRQLITSVVYHIKCVSQPPQP